MEQMNASGKRKRRRYAHLKDSEGNWLIPCIHLPRIPKSDIRRSFGIMFMNVYNSGDFQYMNTFLDRFVSHDYRYVYLKDGMASSYSKFFTCNSQCAAYNVQTFLKTCRARRQTWVATGSSA